MSLPRNRTPRSPDLLQVALHQCEKRPKPFTNRGDGVRAGCPRPTLPSNNNRLAPRLRPSRSSGPGGSGAQKRGVRSKSDPVSLSRLSPCPLTTNAHSLTLNSASALLTDPADTSFRSQIAANTAGKSRARVPRRLDHAMSDRVSRPKTTERATFGRGKEIELVDVLTRSVCANTPDAPQGAAGSEGNRLTHHCLFACSTRRSFIEGRGPPRSPRFAPAARMSPTWADRNARD
jgi:hypothetical protein